MNGITPNHAVRAITLVAALMLFARTSSATTAVMLTDDQLIASSRVILIGDVQSVSAQWDSNQEFIHTYVKLAVARVLKGNLEVEQIVFKQLGGTLGEDSTVIFGSPDFKAGQQVLLFLDTRDDGTLRIAHMFMGRYDVVDDQLSGTTRIERNVDADFVNVLGPQESGEITNSAKLSKFTKKIKKVLKRLAAEVAAFEDRYKDVAIVAIPPEYVDVESSAGEATPSFTFLGLGYRWFEPDTNQAVPYRVNSTGAPVAGGGVAEVNQALAAWTNVAASSIILQNAGSTTARGFGADGVSALSFNDPLDQMQDPVGCSGVLAIGGVTRTGSLTRTIGGQTFRQITEADVVFNKNMECFLGVSTNLAEVATHEIGHSIGFGHSTIGAAIMYAYAHGGGRGATLGADDIAAVTFLYPEAGSPPPVPPLPTAPSSLTANGVSASQINIVWVDNSNNEDGFKVERKVGATGVYAQIAALGANAVSFSDAGLQPSSTCYYRVRSYNGGGTSAYSSEALATTMSGVTPPAPPTGLVASAAGSSQINLSWTDASGNENGFKLERKTGTGGAYSLIATVGANVTSYSNTGLSAATTYYYRVKANNTAGDSGYSNEASITTLPAALQPNDAAFVSQSVPTTMSAGKTYSVSVTFLNTGTTTWSGGSGYKLASQNPFNNTTWGANRVVLPPGSKPVVPGAQITFVFNVKAPVVPGTYNFQWSMWRQSLSPFGQLSTNVAVTVTP